jgi:hypothetical protein
VFDTYAFALAGLADVRHELVNHVMEDVRDEFSSATPRTRRDGQPTSAWRWAGWFVLTPHGLGVHSARADATLHSTRIPLPAEMQPGQAALAHGLRLFWLGGGGPVGFGPGSYLNKKKFP